MDLFLTLACRREDVEEQVRSIIKTYNISSRRKSSFVFTSPSPIRLLAAVTHIYMQSVERQPHVSFILRNSFVVFCVRPDTTYSDHINPGSEVGSCNDATAASTRSSDVSRLAMGMRACGSIEQIQFGL